MPIEAAAQCFPMPLSAQQKQALSKPRSCPERSLSVARLLYLNLPAKARSAMVVANTWRQQKNRRRRIPEGIRRSRCTLQQVSRRQPVYRLPSQPVIVCGVIKSLLCQERVMIRRVKAKASRISTNMQKRQKDVRLHRVQVYGLVYVNDICALTLATQLAS
jgi:hypothetical protein